VAFGLAAVSRRFPEAADGDGARPSLRDAVRVMTRREVFRWLVLLEVSDLLLDVFLGFLALYLVDEVGASPATGVLAVAVWTLVGTRCCRRGSTTRSAPPAVSR
jgi:hypothetical protein